MRLIVIVLVGILSSPLFAQQPPRMGIDAGLTYGRPTSINRKLGAIETFGTNGQGTSFENDLEYGGHLELPGLFSDHTSLVLSLTYIRGSGEFKSNAFMFGDTENSIYRVTSRDERFYLEGAVRRELLPWLFGSAGLWTSYRIRDSLLEERVALAYDSATSVKSGESIATSRFHFGVPISLSSKVTLSDHISLEPEAFARIDLGELFRGFAQDAFSIGARIGLTYDLTAPPQAPTRLEEPPPPHLRATVHFEVGGVSARSVTASESDTIVHRYVMLPNVERLGTFALPEPGATLGDVLRGEAAIIADRVSHRDTAFARLHAPYADQWKERSTVVPSITISKYIESEAGVRSWKIDVRRNDASVAILSDESSLNSSTLDRVFNYSGSRSRDTVVARLETVDIKGTSATADDTLFVTSSNTHLSATVKDQFYIICDTSLSLGSWKEVLISRAAHSTNGKSTITISPLTPAAAECSHLIAAELLALLAKEHMAIQALHEVSASTTVSIPALYERGVLIEVVSPLN